MPHIPLTHANIIELLGIASLPLDKKQEIVESATELVETRILLRVLGMLPEEKKAEFGQVLDTEDIEALNKFFEENSVDYVALMEEEIERVKQELLQTAQED